LKFCRALGKRSITEFNYRYFDSKMAQVFVGITSSGVEADRQQLIQQLTDDGFAVTDMTTSELAKDHIRHMVGGHAPCELNESVYSLQFPERPGALLKFLMSLGSQWNISLFHYRNHGAAFGKVLIGLQIADSQRKAFEHSLDVLGLAYEEETDNPAYRLFAGRGKVTPCA
ncbi:MAG: threonine ammonia-lyase, biosynthetic, partial [Methylomonas sp.]